MTELSDLAQNHQRRLTVLSERTARRVVAEWRRVSPGNLDAGWDAVAPTVERVMSNAQIEAAAMATPFVARSTRMQGVAAPVERAVPASFAGVTRDGRGVTPELFSAVTSTKTLIGRGMGVGAAFQVGTAAMSMLASNIIRDTGRDAARTAGVGRGAKYSVRVVQPGACSRCAILAGVKGYRVDFERHPGCRCTSMWLYDGEVPDGFFASPDEYFESLTPAEQERVFTKSGAWAIREGASPISVVNARRGAYTTAKKHPDGTFGPSRLRPITIGKRPDGSPLQVYATTEGNTARGAWGRQQSLNVRRAGDRYRRTSSLRLMPEQIMTMSQSPEHARELLKKYGYLY